MPLEQKGPIQFSQNETCLLIRCRGGRGEMRAVGGLQEGAGWVGS